LSALAAGVSTWLTYTPDVREYIEAAQRRQHAAATPGPPDERPKASAALRIELDLARQERRPGRRRATTRAGAAQRIKDGAIPEQVAAELGVSRSSTLYRELRKHRESVTAQVGQED
jgi:transcriptional regulator of acetoin/glycerol metabolism